jgi:sulfatase maturation enzyme AslB (radical SAM superfamily)
MNENSYDSVVARKGAFKEFWKGINLLQDHNIPFQVKQSLLPQNRSEIPEFETFAASLPNMHQKPAYTMNFDLRARRDSSIKNRFIKSLRLSPQETLAMVTRDSTKYISEMREFASKFMGQPDDRLFSCGAGLGTCVDAYGNAQMCMLLRHPDTVYPLNSEVHQKRHPDTELKPLEYALTKYFPRVRQQRSKNSNYLNRCARCFLMGLCDQCPAKSWEEYGTLDTPVEYLCQIAHAKGRYLGLLREGEKSWELKEEIWKSRLDKFISGS